MEKRRVFITPNSNLSKQALNERWTKTTFSDHRPAHLTLSGYKGGGYLAKEESQLLAPVSGGWNALVQGCSPLAFPFCFEDFKEWPQQSRQTLPNILNQYLFFKTPVLILTRDSPFECVWMSQNYSAGYPRTGGCFQSTTDGTLLYLAFLSCVSGHVRQTHIIGKPSCIPQQTLGTHARNYYSSKTTSSPIKTPGAALLLAGWSLALPSSFVPLSWAKRKCWAFLDFFALGCFVGDSND